MTKNRVYISNRLIWLIFAAIFSLLLLFDISFLLQIPLIWPDEALIADSALNILAENRNGTDLLKGTLPGAEIFGWGYPPLFFYITAAWFKVFGFSILNQRLLSLGLSLLFLFLFFNVTARLFNGQALKHKSSLILLLASAVLLATDPAYIKAAHIGRPEIAVLVLGFISLFFYLKSQTAKTANIFSLLSGFFLSLAFLSHFLAVIFLTSFTLHALIVNRKKFFTDKKNLFFLTAFLIPLLIWLLLISNEINFLFSDILLRINYKTNAPYWIWIVFSSSPLITKLQYILYFIITWELFLNSWITKSKNGILILLLLVFSWFWTYLWQAEYSFIFTPIFVYLGLTYLIYSKFNNRNNKAQTKLKILLGMGLLMFVFNTWSQFNHLQNLSNGNFDYNLYTDKILEHVPDNTAVYLSAIPDPYYGFKNQRSNKLYEYPILTNQEKGRSDLLQVLDETDYIVFNSPLESIVVGNVVDPYIKANSENIFYIGGEYQYQAFVIRLKPRNSRVH